METLPPKNVSNSDYTLLVTRQQNCTRLILVLDSLIDMLNIRMCASLCFKRMHAHVSSLLRTHLSTITPSFHRSTRHQNSFLSQDHAPVILWTSRDPIHADAMFALLALLSDGKVRFRTVVRSGPWTERQIGVWVRVFARTGPAVPFGVRESPEPKPLISTD